MWTNIVTMCNEVYAVAVQPRRRPDSAGELSGLSPRGTDGADVPDDLRGGPALVQPDQGESRQPGDAALAHGQHSRHPGLSERHLPE